MAKNNVIDCEAFGALKCTPPWQFIQDEKQIESWNVEEDRDTVKITCNDLLIAAEDKSEVDHQLIVEIHMKLIEIKLLINSRFIEVYDNDKYLVTNKGVIDTNVNSEYFLHHINTQHIRSDLIKIKILSLKSLSATTLVSANKVCLIKDMEIKLHSFEQNSPTILKQSTIVNSTSFSTNQGKDVDIMSENADHLPQNKSMPSTQSVNDIMMITRMISMQMEHMLDRKLMPVMNRLDRLERKVDLLQTNLLSALKTDQAQNNLSKDS